MKHAKKIDINGKIVNEHLQNGIMEMEIEMKSVFSATINA